MHLFSSGGSKSGNYIKHLDTHTLELKTDKKLIFRDQPLDRKETKLASEYKLDIARTHTQTVPNMMYVESHLLTSSINTIADHIAKTVKRREKKDRKE